MQSNLSVPEENRAIGIFDSGIGGLTVANAVFDLLPHEKIIYFGDTANIPYGDKTADQVRDFSFRITQFLLNKGCKAIVVACNTASAAALDALRNHWPDVPFIGMEPAVKPAAKLTKTGKVGVLATAGTFKSQRYANLMHAYAQDVTMIQNPCVGLVKLIEEHKIDQPKTRALLESILKPMETEGADTFVLGCTHYPFVEHIIRDIIDEAEHIINPAPAVARQLKRRLEKLNLLNPSNEIPEHEFYASGKKEAMQWAVELVTGEREVAILTPAISSFD
jgi:glutamate racemase